MQSTSLFMFSQVCLCVIERAIGIGTSIKVLYHEWGRENGPLFQAFAWRCSFGDRPLDGVGHPKISVFHFWKNSDTRSPPLRREERLRGLLLGVGDNVFQWKWSKKKGNQAPASLRLIVWSKKGEFGGLLRQRKSGTSGLDWISESQSPFFAGDWNSSCSCSSTSLPRTDGTKIALTTSRSWTYSSPQFPTTQWRKAHSHRARKIFSVILAKVEVNGEF